MGLKVVQLDMLRNEKIEQEVIAEKEFKTNIVKSIRGLFARYNEIESQLLDTHKRMDLISEEIFRDRTQELEEMILEINKKLNLSYGNG